MKLVVDSPVRICHTWLKKPLGPVQKCAVLMRRHLDTYGYAPESIEYCDQETIIAASDTNFVDYPMFSRVVGWLNLMTLPSNKTDEDSSRFVSLLTTYNTSARNIVPLIEGTGFCNLTEVQGQKAAIETGA